MNRLAKAIRREIDARDAVVIGKSLSNPTMSEPDASGAWAWTIKLHLGGNRFIDGVIVRPIGGEVNYASADMAVLARRIHGAKYEVIGPGNSVKATKVIKYYDLDGTPGSTEYEGFTYQKVPFSFYKGPTPGVPGTSLWGSNQYPFGYTRVLDGDGNPVS